MFSSVLLAGLAVGRPHRVYQVSVTTKEYPETQQPICKVQSWLMSSCAAMSIQDIVNVYGLGEVDTLFSYLCQEQWDDLWNPNEIYFLLTGRQTAGGVGALLTKHPNVRKVDSFSNKAHGGATMNLYRYSKANDFSKESVCES